LTGGAELAVVFVCTGNRFRSPLAAALFREATSELPVDVRSMGTLETGRQPAFEEALEHGRRFGLDLSDHQSLAVARGALASADLVVGFEHTHLAVSVVEGGARRDRTFTLPELVELLELDHEPLTATDTAARARQAVEQADAARALAGRSPGHLEIADPVGGPQAVYAATADEIEALVSRLVALLFRA
jgi:low molecular weight protein-tyrosine phosphatase